MSPKPSGSGKLIARCLLLLLLSAVYFQAIGQTSQPIASPGDERQSFLLLGDGNRITLQQFRNAAELQFAGVELLMLS
jgi:hypothetical protein